MHRQSVLPTFFIYKVTITIQSLLLQKIYQTLNLINKCKNVFLQFGIPKELIMDNGPKFSIHKFRSFLKI